MRWITSLIAATALLSCPLSSSLAVAKSHATEMTIRHIAEANALGEYCVNWAVDPTNVADVLRRRKIAVNGRYRDIYGAAYAKAHAEGWKGGNFPASCESAIGLYGPEGSVISGLLRPVWSETCEDCRRKPYVVVP
jgi:hypothetical protein